METTHLNELKKVNHLPQTEVGNIPSEFGKHLIDEKYLSPLISKRLSRKDLESLIQNPKIDTLNVVIAILSWGGIKATKHQKKLFQKTEWILLCEEIRRGKIKTREEAYNKFLQLRKSKKLPGLGPAFFTKLICFLNPSLNGYIMDQWTAKSINLIYNSSIYLSKYGQVLDTNSASDYENFCSKIEELASYLETTPIQAEEIIFSHGGKIKGEWRTYLIKNSK